VSVFASLWFNSAHDEDTLDAMAAHMVAVVADPTGTTALYFRQILVQLLASKKTKAAKTFGRYVKALFRSEYVLPSLCIPYFALRVSSKIAHTDTYPTLRCLAAALTLVSGTAPLLLVSKLMDVWWSCESFAVHRPSY
jgi:hypothetical protein